MKMNLQTFLTGTAVAAAGVLVAGIIMSQLRGNKLIDMAHDGFDS